MKAVSTSLAEQTARAMKKRRVALNLKQAEAAQKGGDNPRNPAKI